jgi:UDP-GlcNAc:undecaprenyl-phosphate GlcNAc-1-phosphate transferase
MLTPILFAFACPLLLALGLTYALIYLAPRLGLIDRPDPRKVHTRPTPRAGGLAVFAAVALTVLLTPPGPGPGGLWLLALGLPLVVLGLLDDLWSLSWQLRLGVQALLALVAVIGSLPGTNWLTGILAGLWIVTLVNAFNMLDNMDMLSAGTAWIAAGTLFLGPLVAGTTPAPGDGFLPVVLMGALSGFLVFNRPPARIFLGDAGSTFLGLFVSLQSLRAALAPEAPAWLVLLPVCLCAVPCYDLVSVVLLRLSQGRSPFRPDRQHLSHRLAARGLSRPWAVTVIHVLALASGASALLLYLVTSWLGAALVCLQAAAWWGALALVEFLKESSHVSTPS